MLTLSKNLKIKIKNEQLAKAVNFDHLKSKFSKKKKAAEESTERVSKPPKKAVAKKVASTAKKPVKKDVPETPKTAQPLANKAMIAPSKQAPKEATNAKKAPLSTANPKKKEVVDTPINDNKEVQSSKTKVPPKEKDNKTPISTETKSYTAKKTAQSAAKKPLAKKKKGFDNPKGSNFSSLLDEFKTTNKSAPLGKGLNEKQFYDLQPLHKRSNQRMDSGRSNDAWKRKRRSNRSKVVEEDTTIRPNELSIRLPITIKNLASAMKIKVSQVISKLFAQGMTFTLNDYLDDETTIQLIGTEFGCEITIDTSEEERIRITDKSVKEEIQDTGATQLVKRPPVVTFMGHVDHGKTSLIDALRKSNIAGKEAGAITQHIGAFRCETSHGDVTILDTPGHEAFSAMRGRGAEVTDIVVLVVAGDEGIREQTIEALQHAKTAGVTIVVAINKSDKEGFDPEQVYRQLSDHKLMPEQWGGSTIMVNCSATSGEGVEDLVEMLALQSEMLEMKANPHKRARGTVLESEMHKGLGCVATVLIQNGTLKLGDSIVFEHQWGKVKTMHDELGNYINEAGPSIPVEITGLSGLPEAGNEFIVVKTEKEAKEIAETRFAEHKQLHQQHSKRISMDKFMQQEDEVEKKALNLVLRADVQGSLEALKTSLLNIKSEKVELNIIFAAVGEITESDIHLAAASKASIIGFHTRIESHAEELLKKNTDLLIFSHDIIYHAIDSVKKLMVDQLDKIAKEDDRGKAEIKAVFKASKLGKIAGCLVTEGTITRNYNCRIIREGDIIWKGRITSLKREKEDVREVKKGLECGILLENYSDILPGDEIQAYEVSYLTQEL